jgi:hypothetical protein
MAEVHAPHVIPSTLSVVVAMCAVAPFAEGAIGAMRCVKLYGKAAQACGGQYVSTAQARLVRGEAKGVTRESAVTRSGWASVGDDDSESEGTATAL